MTIYNININILIILGRRASSSSQSLTTSTPPPRTAYREEVQLDFTPEIEVFHLLFERGHTKNRKRSLKQHMKQE